MRRYTDEQFISAVKESFSIAEVLRKIEVRPTGGNYKVADRRITTLGLDRSHFTGRGHLKGKHHNWRPHLPLSEILVENSTYGGCFQKIRKWMVEEGMLENKCYSCGLTEWLGQPISLELEHKNGNNIDHRKENLTLLCPNCHAQTGTYRGKNKKGKIVKSYRKCIVCKGRASHYSVSGICFRCMPKTRKKNKQIFKCISCDKELKKKTKTGLCMSCMKIAQRKTIRPEKGILLKEVEENGFLAVGRKYGVSDNAIRKWMKNPIDMV